MLRILIYHVKLALQTRRRRFRDQSAPFLKIPTSLVPNHTVYTDVADPLTAFVRMCGLISPKEYKLPTQFPVNCIII